MLNARSDSLQLEITFLSCLLTYEHCPIFVLSPPVPVFLHNVSDRLGIIKHTQCTGEP